MWSSRLFWKLFASYTAVNLLATVTLALMVSQRQQQSVLEQSLRELDRAATLVGRHLSDQDVSAVQSSLQPLVRSLSADIQTRITIVTLNGLVLADSSRETISGVRRLENHKERLELVQAAAAGYGTSQRVSPTLQEPTLYVARRTEMPDGQSWLIRTSVPMQTVASEMARLRAVTLPVAVGVSIAVAALTWILAARVVRPVQTLTTAAESIARGEYAERVFLTNNDELGALARSFNRMTRELDGREAQLRESRQRLMTVLEGMVEGVIALDERERVVLANRAAGQLLDFSPATAQGRPLIEVVRNRAVHEAIAATTQGLSGGEIDVGDNESRVISVHSTTLDSETTTRWILVLHDVTDLRRLESMRREFVANVSHELKTPLSSIKAYSETLLNGALTDSQNNERFVRQIDDQAERLHELIMDLLSIARIESGQQVFEICSLNLLEILQSCVSAHQPSAEAQQIDLRLEQDDKPIPVRADDEGLRQILNNLIGNAIKYTPPRGTVTVKCIQQQSQAVIRVCDTGIGIESKYLPRVFERFFRVDKARSRELGGTGLGLSIVKHLTQSFDGEVHVESQIGEGSVFTVLLPIDNA